MRIFLTILKEELLFESQSSAVLGLFRLCGLQDIWLYWRAAVWRFENPRSAQRRMKRPSRTRGTVKAKQLSHWHRKIHFYVYLYMLFICLHDWIAHNSMIWLPWLPKLRLRDPVVAGCLQVCLLQYQQSVGSFGQTQRAVWQERWSTAIAGRWAFSDLKCFQSKRLLKTYKRNAEEPRLKTLQIMFRSNLVVVPWVLRIAAIYVYMVSRGDMFCKERVLLFAVCSQVCSEAGWESSSWPSSGDEERQDSGSQRQEIDQSHSARNCHGCSHFLLRRSEGHGMIH